MSSMAGIAASGLRAAALGMQASAHNVANLATSGATRQGVALSALAGGGVQAQSVDAAGDPAAPLEDVVAMLGYRVLADASVFVLKVADQTLGSLLDVRA